MKKHIEIIVALSFILLSFSGCEGVGNSYTSEIQALESVSQQFSDGEVSDSGYDANDSADENVLSNTHNIISSDEASSTFDNASSNNNLSSASEDITSSETANSTDNASSGNTETPDGTSSSDSEDEENPDGTSSSILESEDPTEAEKAGFVILSEVIPDVILEVRYYSTYNFVGENIDGYEEPILFLTKEAAEALKKVNDELSEKGYRLKIFDAYRPVMAVDHFVRWSKDLDDQKMKPYFYPDIDKSLIFKKGFVATKSGHSRGSTVDLTLFCDATGKEVDMGGTFDFFGPISYASQTEGLTEEQIANRALLKGTMEKYGFKSAKNEWWHFTLINEPYPNTYFNFPVNSASLNK